MLEKHGILCNARSAFSWVLQYEGTIQLLIEMWNSWPWKSASPSCSPIDSCVDELVTGPAKTGTLRQSWITISYEEISFTYVRNCAIEEGHWEH